MKIPIAKPYIGEEEKQATADVLESGWLVQGRKVAEFEKEICRYSGAKYAKAASSCTTALHLALISLGIGPGDEVLVPSFTFVASANAIEYTGAKPVFTDIDLNSFNMDVGKVEKLLGRKTDRRANVRAIMPVHLFGLCADMSAIMELAKRYDILVIEDAACALGSFCNSHHAGTFGNAGCFSFHPRKLITTGEGGMLVTNSLEISASVSSLRDHGAAISDLERHEKDGFLLPAFDRIGYNYRLTDIQAAIGVEQMRKLQWIIDRRVEKAAKYDKALEDLECLHIPHMPNGYKHSYQSYVVALSDPEHVVIDSSKLEKFHNARDTIMAKLAEKGIATRQGTSAVHRLGYYRKKYGLKDDDFPNSLQAECLSIALPLYPQMTDEEQDYVIRNLRQVVKELSFLRVGR
jgi:perosamine synthetase